MTQYVLPEQLQRAVRSNQAQIRIMFFAKDDPVKTRLFFPRYTRVLFNGHQIMSVGKSPNSKKAARVPNTLLEATNVVTVQKEWTGKELKDFEMVIGVFVRKTDVTGRMMPPEDIPDAVRRMREVVDSGSEDEVSMESITVSLRCPVSMAMIKRPVYFHGTSYITVYDMDTLVDMFRRSGEWKCPATRKPVIVANLRVHTYMEAVLKTVGVENMECEAIEINSDGDWRPSGSDQGFRSIKYKTLFQELDELEERQWQDFLNLPDDYILNLFP